VPTIDLPPCGVGWKRWPIKKKKKKEKNGRKKFQLTKLEWGHNPKERKKYIRLELDRGWSSAFSR
jgi:hypothetical protein